MHPSLINFELFYLNGDYDQLDLETKRFQLIKEEIDNSKSTEIVGLLLNDGLLYIKNQIFLETLRSIKKYIDQTTKQKLTLLVGMCAESSSYLENNDIDVGIEFLNFPHWMVAKGYEHRASSNIWNHSADKFLFLGGVPSRYNRIILLSKLYDAGLLDRAVWSFFPPWNENDRVWCRNALGHYTDDEYQIFLNFANKKIDDVYDRAKDYSRLSGKELKEKNIYQERYLKDVGYIDPAVFSGTLFSIVSEGNAYPPADNFYFLTEKIWRSVVNRHPFILAGYPEQVKYAKKIGLRTFEDYFLISDYYLIENEHERLDAIVENVRHFLSNYSHYISDIRNDVEYNYNVFWEIYNTSQQHIQRYSLDDQRKFFDHCGWAHLIRIPDVD